MKKNVLLFLVLTIFGCKAKEIPTQFSSKALNDTFISVQGQEITFQSLLNQYKGKTIFIDVWASWCKDCIVGMPKIKSLQTEKKDVVFLFLSLDKSIDSWKKGIKKHNTTGEHYYMQSGWDGPFAKFIDLDWIPRYMVIDKEQNIKLFKAIKPIVKLKKT